MKNKQHILSIICLLILLLPNIATMALSTDLTYSWVKEAGYLLMVGVCLAIPMAWLHRRTYFIVEGIIGLFWMPIEISSLFLNKITVSAHFLSLILETNRVEAFELIISIWPVALGLVGIWGLYGWLVSRMDNKPLLPRWTQIPALAIAIAIIGLSTTIDIIGMKFYKIYPYDIYIQTHQLWQETNSIRRSQKQLEKFQFDLNQKTDSVEEHYIVLIGEAARYDHFHCNGYARSTSPELDSICTLYSLTNVYAQANRTFESIQFLLTRADVLHPQVATNEKSIVEAFSQVGFQTAWLSCQTMMDIEKRMALHTDFQYEQVGGLSAQVPYDEILVQKAQEIFHQSPSTKSFFLFHGMGSHLKYDQRYPKEYEHFVPAIQASDGYAVLSAKNKEMVVNAYDNTILYTDHVIAQSIHLLQQQKGIRAFIYISDHGENLFDDERALSVHCSYEGTIYEAHVPCFIWLSDEFKQTYPEKVAALQANLHKQIQNDILFHTLADMGGLHPIVNEHKSVFSPTLCEQDTIRMLTGNGNIVILQPTRHNNP